MCQKYKLQAYHCLLSSSIGQFVQGPIWISPAVIRICVQNVVFDCVTCCTGAEVDKPDKEEQTALHICVQNAIVHSSYAAVERLLAAGARVNV